MLSWIESTWPLILVGFYVMGTLSGLIKQFLDIRRLRLEIRDMNSKVDEYQKRIISATKEEIERFGDKMKETIDEKIESSDLKAFQLQTHTMVGKEIIEELERILDEFSRVRRMEEHRKRMKEIQSSYKPEGLQLRILTILGVKDSPSFKVADILRELADISILELKGCLGEMEEIGILTWWVRGPDFEECKYDLTDFGARMASSCVKSPQSPAT